MPKVSNLKIASQSGSDNTYVASWEFNEETKSSASSTSSTDIKKGDLVEIKSGATWYNGSGIPDWVSSVKWYVLQITGDRAVLNKSPANKSYAIMSPINVKNITKANSSSSSSSSTTTEYKKTLDHYTVNWYYDTGDDIWFHGGESEVKSKFVYSTYSPPDNALKIKVTVKPVSKTYKENDKDKSYWTGTSVSKTFDMLKALPDDPPKPEVTIDESLKLTATVSWDSVSDDELLKQARIDKVQFEVYRVDGSTNKKIKTGSSTVKMCEATFSCTVTIGGTYRVRCRTINLYGKSQYYSENWSPWSEEIKTVPSSVTNLKCVADSETSVKLTWKAPSTATEYEIEYTTDKKYFDTTSSAVKTSTSDKTTTYIDSLDTGETWYFRVRAKNSDAEGYSKWSSIVSTVIGTKPEAPTTWSLASSVIVGENVTLYWTHNSEDGSKQSAAEIYLTIGSNTDTIKISESTNEDEEETIHSYSFSTSSYTEGATIRWKIRTKGVVADYSDWSTTRTITLYANPGLDLSLPQVESNILTALPLDISLYASPTTQKPISYHVSIVAKRTYNSVDVLGNTILVTAGSEVYTKLINNPSRSTIVSISAGDIVLENNQHYEIIATAAMDSGLSTETRLEFTVEWEDHDYMPDASISIDFKNLTAYIEPRCINTDEDLVSDVTLSVYRREYNGTFTEIAKGIKNNGATSVTDPHPSLDYARYRIVALDSVTGNVIYEDLPGQPVHETAIVIQWDEDWTEFDYGEEDAPEVAPWAGSMIKLPYNVDVTENHDADVSLVEYIGREHPVSYYGTQRGESASWSAVIPKSDKDTLYALRRLAAWRGDVYVREPSGTGYWARVNVTFPLKHLDLTVPVSINISRVEGGA